MSEISPKVFYSSASTPKEEKLVLVFSSALNSKNTQAKCQTLASSSFQNADKIGKKQICKKKNGSNMFSPTYTLRSKKIPATVFTNIKTKRNKAIFSSALNSEKTPTKCQTRPSSSFHNADKIDKTENSKKITGSNMFSPTYTLRLKKSPATVFTNIKTKRRKPIFRESTEMLTSFEEKLEKTTSEKLLKSLPKESACKKVVTPNEICNFSQPARATSSPASNSCKDSIEEKKSAKNVFRSKTSSTYTLRSTPISPTFPKTKRHTRNAISRKTTGIETSTRGNSEEKKREEKTSPKNVIRSKTPSSYTLRSKTISPTFTNIKRYSRNAISRKITDIETSTIEIFEAIKTNTLENLPMSLSKTKFTSNESASTSHFEPVSCNISEVSNCSEVCPLITNESLSTSFPEATNSIMKYSDNKLMQEHELPTFCSPNINNEQSENVAKLCKPVRETITVISNVLIQDSIGVPREKDCNLNQKELEIDENVSMGTEAIFHSSTEIRPSLDNNSTTRHESVKYNSTEISNFSNSSALVPNESLSEYMPNSTDDVTIASNNNVSLEEIEKSVNEIKLPLNITKVTVPYSSQSKKHFCVFCKTLQTKLARHFLLKHKSEKEIKAISSLPKKHIDRLKMFNKLRKDGDFLHNTTHSLNTGILIVSRQQNSKAKNVSDDYVCCRNCKGFFSKISLKFHMRGCGKHLKNDRSNMIQSRRMTQYIHEEANEILKTKIFPVLRNDEVTNAIRYDDLIIKYGNKMSQKYTLTHQHDMIRSQLRLLGRFKICVQELCPDIENLKEIFKPQMHDTCIKAVHKVAKWDNTSMWFKTPAVAQSLTSLIKKCGYKQKTEFIKIQEDSLKKNVEDFLQLWEEEVPVLINKKAYEDQENQKRIKKIVLPSKEDIKKLYIFLKNEIMTQIKVLQVKFCSQSWIDLIKATLIFIQIFNRRRAGEIERLTLSNYKNKEVITDSAEEALLKEMSAGSLQFAKQFVRIVIRGKLGRTVGVLLSPLCITAIDIIIKYRNTAGIPTSNEYIFSKISTSKLSKPYFRACPLLREFSTTCGATLPESLRGTTLRKHIATYTSLLNVEEATVDKLANFMGHHKDIHKNIYRMSVPVNEITCVSQLLMNAIVGDDDEMRGNTADEGIEVNKYLEIAVEESSDSAESIILEDLPKKKRRSRSPFGKTKRSRWNEEEKQAVSTYFGCLKDLQRLPSILECNDAINKLPVLKRRTPQQLKTWIDNQRRYT